LRAAAVPAAVLIIIILPDNSKEFLNSVPWFLPILIISIFHPPAELNSKDSGQHHGASGQPLRTPVPTEFQLFPDLQKEKIITAITVQLQLHAPHAMIGMNGVNGIRQPIQTAFNN